MKYIFYLLTVLILIISCAKKETQAGVHTNKQIEQDSISVNDFGEHKGIHQQEWEEHQKESRLDTLETSSN